VIQILEVSRLRVRGRSQSRSGKVATLSDAVQYVKSLELENEGLHGRLDVMQRRNNTLQKIALSRADTNAPATSINIEAHSDESNSRRAARGGTARQQKDEFRAKAVAHASSFNKRPGSVVKSDIETLTAIKICDD